MRSTPITFDEMRDQLKRLVRNEPDFVYKKPAGARACMYIHLDPFIGTPRPGCIVGHAMLNLGIDEAVLLKQNAASVAQFSVDIIDPTAAAYARKVQENQDEEMPWGEALDQAEAAYIHYGIQHSLKKL